MMRFGMWTGLLALGGFLMTTSAEEAKPPVSSKAREVARLLNQAFIEVAEEVSPAVVVIDVAQREDPEADLSSNNPWFEFLPEEWKERFRKQQREPGTPRENGPEFNGQGSGMIMDSEGHILTNHHVVDNAEKIRVRLRDGRQFEAEVRGTDEQSDLAVLQLKNAPTDLPKVRFGNSDQVRVGQFAIAIGAPFRLDYSVTFGHVSAKGRTSVVPAMMGGGMMDQDFIQTDASINPGNSGGPLVNIEGEVIGINSMIRGMNSGIGFSVPVNLAREISSRLIQEGQFVRSWLGIGIGALREMEEVQALVPGLTEGVVITRVMTGGPASEADPSLKSNDVITSVDGKRVSTPAELRAIVTRKPAGSTVQLEVRRGKEAFQSKVSPRAMPKEMVSSRDPHPRRPSGSRDTFFQGMKLKLLSPSEAQEAQVEGGAKVLDVEEASPAAQHGIKTGDIITEVNHRSITNGKELREALSTADPKKGVVLVVRRNGKELIPILKDPSPEKE